MADFVVTFNGSMDDVTFDQINNIQQFLQAEITTDYEGEDDVWLVDTAQALDARLMNTALARAGIRNRTTVSVNQL